MATGITDKVAVLVIMVQKWNSPEQARAITMVLFPVVTKIKSVYATSLKLSNPLYRDPSVTTSQGSPWLAINDA